MLEGFKRGVRGMLDNIGDNIWSRGSPGRE